jgi:hypothetical protein
LINFLKNIKMQNNNKTLELVINGTKHEWHEQYITGATVKKIGGIDAGETLFLDIESPWEDELILNETRVDLARPGIESFISKHKNHDTILLTIETPKGKWENVAFNKKITVGEIIKKVIEKYGFAADGKYQLSIKGKPGKLDLNSTLEQLCLPDHSVLVFSDLGSGANE